VGRSQAMPNEKQVKSKNHHVDADWAETWLRDHYEGDLESTRRRFRELAEIASRVLGAIELNRLSFELVLDIGQHTGDYV
jgi:hypothetical protein